MTVTDAHVWLGRLPEDAFLGGESRLDRTAVEPHLADLARGLDVGLDEAAEGILAVADSAMERALRVISVEKGYDPVDFAVLAFGGAGALHVAELTQRLGAARALVPPDPGLLSAYGMLAAPVTREASRTVLLSTADPEHAGRVATVFDELEERAVRGLLHEGAERADIAVERRVDARYEGQSFELQVPATDWVEAFHESHDTRYGYRRQDTSVEAVTLRAVARAPGPPLQRMPPADAGVPRSGETTPVVFRGGRVRAALLWRRDLGPGHTLEGPAVVREYSATTWVPPGWTLRVDEVGVLHLLAPG